MKAFLICPAERSEVGALAEAAPLTNLCILGTPFIYYWLEYLSGRGVKDVKILAADRPDQVRTSVGDGSRWGLRIEVIPQFHELSCSEVKEKYLAPASRILSNPSDDVILIDHFPGYPEEKLFENYAAFVSSVQLWISKKPGHIQIGTRQIKPGIWVGLRTQISPRAKLHPPCWIGDNVSVRPDVEIGPNTILESGVIVENGTAVSNAWIGRQTFVGSLTQVKNSLAFGNTLVNFNSDSVAKIPDAFLLCSLKDRTLSVDSGNLFGRCAALIVLLLTLPLGVFTVLKARWLGQRALRLRRATAPQIAEQYCSSITYYEFTNSNGWWRRWPQLWNVVRGEFTWIGNRPLTSIESGALTNEFERLWLAAPIGLISQGDAEGCSDLFSDEARAHASFYATQATWRSDLSIFIRAIKRLVSRKGTFAVSTDADELKERPIPLASR